MYEDTLMEKLNYLLETKDIIKQAIIDIGSDTISDETIFRNYADEILSIHSNIVEVCKYLNFTVNGGSLDDIENAEVNIKDTMPYIQELLVCKNKLSECLNVKGVTAENIEAFIDLVEKVLLIETDSSIGMIDAQYVADELDTINGEVIPEEEKILFSETLPTNENITIIYGKLKDYTNPDNDELTWNIRFINNSELPQNDFHIFIKFYDSNGDIRYGNPYCGFNIAGNDVRNIPFNNLDKLSGDYGRLEIIDLDMNESKTLINKNTGYYANKEILLYEFDGANIAAFIRYDKEISEGTQSFTNYLILEDDNGNITSLGTNVNITGSYTIASTCGGIDSDFSSINKAYLNTSPEKPLIEEIKLRQLVCNGDAELVYGNLIINNNLYNDFIAIRSLTGSNFTYNGIFMMYLFNGEHIQENITSTNIFKTTKLSTEIDTTGDSNNMNVSYIDFDNIFIDEIPTEDIKIISCDNFPKYKLIVYYGTYRTEITSAYYEFERYYESIIFSDSPKYSVILSLEDSREDIQTFNSYTANLELNADTSFRVKSFRLEGNMHVYPVTRLSSLSFSNNKVASHLVDGASFVSDFSIVDAYEIMNSGRILMTCNTQMNITDERLYNSIIRFSINCNCRKYYNSEDYNSVSRSESFVGFIDENGNFALNPSVEKQINTNELHDLILENKRVGIITSDNDMSSARISTISCLKVENFEDVLNGKLEPIWYESFSIGSEYSDGSYKDSYNYNSGLVSIKTKDLPELWLVGGSDNISYAYDVRVENPQWTDNLVRLDNIVSGGIVVNYLKDKPIVTRRGSRMDLVTYTNAEGKEVHIGIVFFHNSGLVYTGFNYFRLYNLISKYFVKLTGEFTLALSDGNEFTCSADDLLIFASRSSGTYTTNGLRKLKELDYLNTSNDSNIVILRVDLSNSRFEEYDADVDINLSSPFTTTINDTVRVDFNNETKNLTVTNITSNTLTINNVYYNSYSENNEGSFCFFGTLKELTSGQSISRTLSDASGDSIHLFVDYRGR